MTYYTLPGVYVKVEPSIGVNIQLGMRIHDTYRLPGVYVKVEIPIVVNI